VKGRAFKMCNAKPKRGVWGKSFESKTKKLVSKTHSKIHRNPPSTQKVKNKNGMYLQLVVLRVNTNGFASYNYWSSPIVDELKLVVLRPSK